MRLNRGYYLFLMTTLCFISCENDSDTPLPTEDFTTIDFVKYIDEGQPSGTAIGFINAFTSRGSLVFTLLNQTSPNAISVGVSSGQVIIEDSAAFIFSRNRVIAANVEVSNGFEVKRVHVTINIKDPSGSRFNIWSGGTITFTKVDGADPEEDGSQDKITDNVWITRGNEGGHIFNIKVESSHSTLSPQGTEWAFGTTDQIETIAFDAFRNTVNPKSMVGRDLVLHLIDDDIYIDLKFTSWSQNRMGGFSYERSTK